MAGTQHLLAALRHLRAEQRGHGTERQDGVAITLAYVPMNAKRLPFARRKMRTRNLLMATPGTPFQVGHSKTLKANKRRSHIEIELVRLRPTTHSKEPTCFISGYI